MKLIPLLTWAIRNEAKKKRKKKWEKKKNETWMKGFTWITNVIHATTAGLQM